MGRFHWAGVVGVVCVAGCYMSHERPAERCGRRIEVERVEDIDLLFLVDDSNSMSQEQALLRAEIPRAIGILATGDRDRDGVRDFVTPVRSLHVGIVSSDMGAGDVPPDEVVPSCDPGFGDDGILVSTTPGMGECEAEYPSRVFAFDRERDDGASFARDIGCVADLGTGGCGFEQQLEVMLKAVSPARPQPWVSAGYVAPAFRDGSLGHGDGANEGFLRASSVLALIVLSDEEDCSVPDTTLFYPNTERYRGTGLNLRCHRFAEDLYPVERYIEGFLQLRDDPSRLIFAPIVGVPTDLVGLDVETILADPRVEEREDPSMSPPIRLLPSCETASGVAFPPRRILEVSLGLEARGALTTVQSICAGDFGAAVDRIIERIEEALRGACIPELATDADGRVACTVYQVLAPRGTPGRLTECEAAGLTRQGVLGSGARARALCRVPQLVPPSDPEGTPEGLGFWYDDRSSTARASCAEDGGRRLAFAGLREPVGEFRVRCDHRPIGGVPTVETPCAGSEECATARAPRGDVALTCEPLRAACLVPCASDADCAEAGLFSYACEQRTNAEVATELGVPLGALDPSEAYGFCTNPVCF